MSERKVLNKYFPPDFDPSKIPRRKIPKDKQQVVRLMAPFSMRCNTCGEYIYKGKKFNARKETVQGENYFGIKIFRFYIKCTRCSAEITFKTDPKNTDYVAEHGASRNFEPWRQESGPSTLLTDEERLDQLQAEEENPMEALENRTVDSKREMDILDKLQEIKMRNARLEKRAKEVREAEGGMLGAVSGLVEMGGLELGMLEGGELQRELEKRREEDEIEEEVRRVFLKRGGSSSVSEIGSGGEQVADIELDEDLDPNEDIPDLPSSSSKSFNSSEMPPPPLPIASSSKSATPIQPPTLEQPTMIKRKLSVTEDEDPTPEQLLSEETRKLIKDSFKDNKKKKLNGGTSSKPAAGGKEDLRKKLGIKIAKK